MSTTIHMIVGSITLLLFLVNVAMYAMEMSRGAIIPAHRMVSFAASGFLMIQYVLGFGLLMEDKSISMWHYLIAILAFLPVGMEHMGTGKETNIRKRSTIGLVASLLTFACVFAAYMIGEMR